MKCYDAQTIYRYVCRNKAKLDRVDVGIMEDWISTNQRIYADGRFLIDFPRDNKKFTIRGIQGSMWGTPVMRVVFVDGTVNVLNAYKSVGRDMAPNKVQSIIAEFQHKGIKMLGWDGVLR